jgi:hypothetical protein
MENVTEKTIKSVNVEDHLSNGKELAPTKQMDLAPARKLWLSFQPPDNPSAGGSPDV